MKLFLSSLMLAMLAAFMPWSAAAGEVRFIVFGDMPYGGSERRMLKKLAPELKTKVPFAIHFGDSMPRNDDCKRKDFERNRALITGIIGGPVFFTPGDNDWTDCDAPLPALNVIMDLYFSAKALPETVHSLDDSWQVARQPSHAENARWSHGALQFVTLHIVGSENGWLDAEDPHASAQNALVAARDGANLKWLAESFRAASTAEALVIAIHADITAFSANSLDPCTEAKPTDCHPYIAFQRALAVHASKFGKPILMVHGDTGPYCVDRSERFGLATVSGLVRLNGPGDGHPGLVEVAFEDGGFTFSHIGDTETFTDSCN